VKSRGDVAKAIGWRNADVFVEGGGNKGEQRAHKHRVSTYSYKKDVATSLHCRTTSVLRAQPLAQAKLRRMRCKLTAHIHVSRKQDVIPVWRFSMGNIGTVVALHTRV
jgi:hypothetical protein